MKTTSKRKSSSGKTVLGYSFEEGEARSRAILKQQIQNTSSALTALRAQILAASPTALGHMHADGLRRAVTELEGCVQTLATDPKATYRAAVRRNLADPL